MTQIVPYSIKQGQFAADHGPITYSTSLQGFTFNTTNSQSLTFGLPSPATSILFNSTITSIQLSGISFFYKPEGYRTLITIQGIGAGIPVCIPVSGIGGKIAFNSSSNPQEASIGRNILDWSDIPVGMNPGYNSTSNQLCYTPPIGNYSIDPLAIDGTATSVVNGGSFSLTTSTGPDIIVVLEHDDNPGCNTPTSASFTFHLRAVEQGGDGDCVAEYYDVAASSGTFTLACNYTTGSANFCVAFGISGAASGCSGGGTGCFDSNGALPCENANPGASTTPNCTISTSNANDIIIGAVSAGNNHLWTAGSGFTFITSGSGANNACSTSGATNRRCDQYQIVSSTQSGLSVQISISSPDQFWDMIADAIKQAAATTVTQPIKITTDNSASACSVGITGGSPSNSSFNGNGNVHTYTLSASTTITLTLTASTNTRCEWNVSPHPTASLTITFTTCGTPGPCSQYTNTSYYQHRDNYSATPVGPVVWDITTSFTVTGTFLGAASQTLGTGSTMAGGGTATIPFVWADYNRAATVSSPIHSNWNAFPPGSNVFTQTTGGHSNNVNYAIAGGTSSGAIFADFLIAAIVVGFMITGVFVARRNR